MALFCAVWPAAMRAFMPKLQRCRLICLVFIKKAPRSDAPGLLVLFIPLKAHQDHRHGDDERQGVGDGAGGEDAVDAHELRQDDEKRYQEEPLPRQRHQKPVLRVVGGGEVGDGDRLYVLEEHEHHVNLEIFLGELEIQVRARSEYRDDFAREQLQQGEEDDADGERRRERPFVGPFDALVVFRAEVVAPDGLAALRYAHRKRNHNHIGFLCHSRHRERDDGAVMRGGAVGLQHVVEHDVGGHEKYLVHESGYSRLHAVLDVSHAQADVAQPHLKRLESREVHHGEHERDDLRYYRRRRSAFDAPSERIHEEPVEPDVERRSHDVENHGVAWTAVGAYRGGGSRGKDVKRQPYG